MNKQEFSNLLAVKLNKTKKEASFITEVFLDALKEGLIEDKKVAFSGDFSLEIVPTLARMGHNPATGEKIEIPAGRKIRFKAGKLLKDLISG
jgi:DNA-binding protein HU-beta